MNAQSLAIIRQTMENGTLAAVSLFQTTLAEFLKNQNSI